MKSTFFISILIAMFCLLPLQVDAQMEREPAITDSPVSATWKAPRIAVFYSTKAIEKNTMDMSILHTFGPVGDGYEQLFGLDSPANIRLALNYGFTEKFSLGLGRSKFQKNVDLNAKYTLLEQLSDDSVPVTLAATANTGIRTDPNAFIESYSVADRLNFSASLLTARKMSPDLSLQLTTTISHFNKVNLGETENTFYGAGLSGRYKVSNRTALSVEFMPVFSSDETNYISSIGIDIETGSHVFQMFFTTSHYYTMSQAMRFATDFNDVNGDFSLLDSFRFGFNVNRIFWFDDRGTDW